MRQRSRGWIAGAVFVTGAGLLAATMLRAQTSSSAPPQETRGAPEPQQGPPIKVETKVVNVVASVRDKKGMLVSNLTKDDFVIDEDGRTQTIAYFARDSDVPVTLGLLVDTSGSQRAVLADERDASQAFLENVMRPDEDKAFLIHFDHEVELLQDLTDSREKLQKALNEMDAPQFGQPSQVQGRQGQGGGSQGGGYPRGGGGRRGGSFQGGGTTLYDAVYLASQEVIRKQMGRKALIVLSDGVDRGSKESLASAIEAAQRSDTIVYAIYFGGEQQPPFGFGGGPFGGGEHRGGGGRFPQQDRADGKKILEQMTKETGGKLFEVSKKDALGQIYSSISEELRDQYSLGYTPEPDPGYGYHKVHLTTKRRDLMVQARDGYFE